MKYLIRFFPIAIACLMPPAVLGTHTHTVVPGPDPVRYTTNGSGDSPAIFTREIYPLEVHDLEGGSSTVRMSMEDGRSFNLVQIQLKNSGGGNLDVKYSNGVTWNTSSNSKWRTKTEAGNSGHDDIGYVYWIEFRANNRSVYLRNIVFDYNNAADTDGDNVADSDDAFPHDASEYSDTDGDGTGNNADTDDDGDGVEDGADAFPLDAAESVDTDGD